MAVWPLVDSLYSILLFCSKSGKFARDINKLLYGELNTRHAMRDLPAVVYGQVVFIILMLKTVQGLTLLNQDNSLFFIHDKRNLLW